MAGGLAADRPVAGRWDQCRQIKECDIISDSVNATAPDLCAIAKASLQDDKAQDIAVIELAGKTSIADHMIIASGRSQRHVTAAAQRLLERLKAMEILPIGVEGLRQGDWVLVDAGDVIIHIFRPEVRAFYNLEKMWSVPMPEELTG